MNTGTDAQFATVLTPYPPFVGTTSAELLTEDNRDEAIRFLERRPVNTVILAGWIRDFGIISPKHRGKFYGCRDANGVLNGVAMIGLNLLFEADTDEAIEAFARCAQDCPDVRMIFAEEEKLAVFWRHYRGTASIPQMTKHRLITSSGHVSDDIRIVKELRVATLTDLDQIVAAHAAMVLDDTGVDPLTADADGFRMRCALRVEQGRVWVWMNGVDLIFKVDIVSDTPAVIYTEGLWVKPEERVKGYGTRCFASIAKRLSTGMNTICGFADEARISTTDMYKRTGFSATDRYSRVYL